MINNKYCKGLLGGLQGKALYFVGSIDTDLIYLDPHYVIQFKENNNMNNYCKNIKYLNINDINSTVTFSFLFTHKELQQGVKIIE